MTLLSSTGFPLTAGGFRSDFRSSVAVTNTASLASDYNQNVGLRSTGETIGIAGALFFGVGPATSGGVPRGINVNDYCPTHAASGSFM